VNIRERLLKTLRGEPHDRVPLVLEGFGFNGREEIETIDDPLRRELAERVYPHVNGRVHVGGGGNRYFVTPQQAMTHDAHTEPDGTVVTTTRLDTPAGELTAVASQNPITRTSWHNKYPCESLADIEKIRSIPWQMPPKIAPPDTSDLPDAFGERSILMAGTSSPFVCVAGMMPYEYFLELCATEFELLRELTAECLRRELDLLEAVLAEHAVEYVWMGGCEWVTPPMASPKIYEALVQPFEAAIIERVHAAGAFAHVHCHGNVRDTIDLAVARGADFFEPVEPPPDGDIPFAEAKQRVAGRMALGGNIEARILECGTLDEVAQATRAAFEGPNDRMVLQTTAGPIGRMNPQVLANYHRMVDLWEQLSPLN